MGILVGDQGNDFLEGGNSIDLLIGFEGDDTLKGGDNTDVLLGNQGDDLLVGDRGDDFMFGGQDNDRMVWNNGDGSDLMEGGEGIDTVEVNGSIEQGDQFTLNANGERAQFDRINLGPFTLDVDDSEEFSVNGGGGDDSFEVNDLTGTDVQTVRFNGGEGNDTLNATNSSTPIFAEGGAGDDQLLGSSAVDTLNGDDGNDVVVGNRGDDQMFGGTGDDRLIWNNGDGSDLMEGGEGIDTVEVNGSVQQGDQFTLNANGERAQFDRINLGPFTLDVDDSEEFNVNGGGGDDSFEVNDLTGTDVQTVRFNGGEGNDTLNATNSSTPIFAEGGAGDDELLGGSGNDTLIGGEGDDILIGGAGDDILIGDLPSSPAIAVINTLSGGDGSDDFILGNAETAYYNDGDDATAGFNDFALIADFNTEFDRIQLNGDASRYVLNETSVEAGSGTGIYLDTNADGIYGETDELIGVVADVGITTTSADYFQYV